MSDNSSTGQQVVFIVTLLGVFFILVMAMPSGFYATAPDYELSEIPDYWTPDDIKATRYWGNNTDVYDVPTLYPPTYHSITIGSGTLDETIRVMWFRSGDTSNFYFEHYWYQWGWMLVAYHIEPYPLTETEVVDNIDADGNFSRFSMTCDHFNYVVYFANNATYADLEDALDAGHIVVSAGVGFNTEQTVISGWDIVGRLMAFQLPDVTTEINAIIALPLWTMIGFLVFVTITMIVDMLPLT